MKYISKKILIPFVLIGLGIGHYLISPLFIKIELNEESPLMSMKESEKNEIKSIIKANFIPEAHEVEGEAILIEKSNENIIRFENFKTVNGPNLHIYLAADLGAKDFIDLGKIKATIGNANYSIDENIDLKKYNKVLVWCVPFRVLFSYAELKI